ncbi:MDR family MFS transporter [Streptomyces sp. NPDC002911]
MTEVTTTPQAHEHPELSRRAAFLIVTGLLLAVFMSALDSMIMATAMRTVADELHGMTLQAWATTGYLITATVSLPLHGKLSDIFGRKRLYMVAIVLFLLGSVLCAMAESMYELALYRAVQGLGGGGLGSLALAVLADLFPPERRAVYQAYLGTVFGVASVLGPVAGGLFAGMDSFLGISGWRWIFLINVPIGIVTLVVVGRLFRLRHRRTEQRVDYWGAAALITGLVPLLLIAEQGKVWGWGSARALLAYAVGVLGLLTFLMVERRMGDEALVPPRLFTNSAFSRVNVVNYIGGIGVFTSLTFMPLYLQVVQGLEPTQAGLLMLPQSLATTLGARLSGPVVARTRRYRMMLAGGLGLLAAAYFLLARVGVDTPLWGMVVLAAMMGLGLGVFMQTVLVALQNNVPPQDMGVASGMYSFSRQLGAITGTAVFLSVLFGIAASRIAEAFRAALSTPALDAALSDPAVLSDPDDRQVLADLRAGGPGIDLDDTSVLDTLDPRIARPVLEGMASGINTVFWILGALTLVAVAVALTLREGARGPAGARPDTTAEQG